MASMRKFSVYDCQHSWELHTERVGRGTVLPAKSDNIRRAEEMEDMPGGLAEDKAGVAVGLDKNDGKEKNITKHCEGGIQIKKAWIPPYQVPVSSTGRLRQALNTMRLQASLIKSGMTTFLKSYLRQQLKRWLKSDLLRLLKNARCKAPKSESEGT